MNSVLSSSLRLQGRHSPGILALLLGRLLHGQNKIKQAEEVYRRALRDFGSTSSDWEPIAALLREYIRIITWSGNFCHAESVYDPVLRNFILRLGRCHETTLVLIYEIGNALWTSGALWEAEKILSEAILGINIRDHHNTIMLRIIDKLGTLYTQQGRWKEAEDVQHAALKGSLSMCKDYYHPKVIAIVLSLGNTLCAQGKLQDAAQMLQWGSSCLQQTLGLAHADTIHAFEQLAMIHMSTKNFANAEPALSSFISGCESLYGKNSARTFQKNIELAILFRDQAKFLEGQAACELLLGACETLESEWKFFVLNCLGTIDFMAGQFSKAEEEFTAALNGFRASGGQGSPLALLVLYNMGNMHHAKGRPDLAEAAFRETLAGMRQAVGHNHVASLAAAEMLGLSLISQGKMADAAKTWSENLSLCKSEDLQSSSEARRTTADKFQSMTLSYLASNSQRLSAGATAMLSARAGAQDAVADAQFTHIRHT
ncbi:hypothetical protein MY1884_008085 [Beauveria asiatica]